MRDWQYINIAFMLTLSRDIRFDDEVPNGDALREYIVQGLNTGYLACGMEELRFRHRLVEIVACPGLYRETFACTLSVAAEEILGGREDFNESLVVAAADDGFAAVVVDVRASSLLLSV